MLNSYALRRALSDKKYKKIFVERLTEPLHLNLISAGVALFGSYRAKVAFDLMVRQQYAFPVLFAADEAKKLGLKRIQVLEFGVATGAGLLNLCDCAARTEAETGIAIEVVGERQLQVSKAPTTEDLLARLRKYRGCLPEGFKFDRMEANARD